MIPEYSSYLVSKLLNNDFDTEPVDIASEISGMNYPFNVVSLLKDATIEAYKYRSIWNLTRAAGLTTSLKYPFTKATFQVRLHNTNQFTGVPGQVKYFIDRIEQATNMRKTKFGNFIYKSLVGEPFESSLMDRYLLPKGKFVDLVSQYDQTLSRNISASVKTETESLYRKFLSHVIDSSPKGPVSKIERATSFFKPSFRKTHERHIDTVYDAFHRFMSEMSPSSIELIKNNTEPLEQFAKMSARRLTTARIAKFGAGSLFAAPIVADMLTTGIRLYTEFTAKTANTLHNISKLDFGGSVQILQNSAMATERQRAMAAIRDAQLNARSLLGNEAAYLA